MGKATELDESIRPLSPAEIAARRAAIEVADDDVQAALDGRLVKQPKSSNAPREVQPARKDIWD